MSVLFLPAPHSCALVRSTMVGDEHTCAYTDARGAAVGRRGWGVGPCAGPARRVRRTAPRGRAPPPRWLLETTLSARAAREDAQLVPRAPRRGAPGGRAAAPCLSRGGGCRAASKRRHRGSLDGSRGARPVVESSVQNGSARPRSGNAAGLLPELARETVLRL